MKKHIFEEEELEETSVVRKFRTTAPAGESYSAYRNTLKGVPTIWKTLKFLNVKLGGRAGTLSMWNRRLACFLLFLKFRRQARRLPAYGSASGD